MYLEAELDWETGERAGAGGTFQVIGLTNEAGEEVTDKVDQGRHFKSIEDLETELTKVFGEPVTVEEV